ncbi:hypothetical protein CMV_013932 [Castanea mollissima]|uniref:Aminotransferase-like plant mobile domain-containing protein n=1 Tax=Castanea mollissima TaxID=60419 RepID=A0A8J4RCJ1_9ROSI|nr:hypothetical protein CMV_013932 [Castanea mollissima]
MAAANAGQIDHAQPGPVDESVLTLQANHRLEAIWNGQVVVGPKQEKQARPQLPGQVVWQPYEAKFEDLPPWYVAGRAVWTATVPLVCFHLVEKHTPDHVVHQFGMIQEISRNVDTDTVLHAIDLRGKVGVDWMRKHAAHITKWGNHLQRCCEAVLGDMPPQHEYFNWYKRVTRRFINVLGARLIIMIEGYACLLRHHPVGTKDHKDITDVLKAVQEIGRVQPPIPKALNEEAATPMAAPTQSPSTFERPSKSRAPTGRGSCPPVTTQRVVPTPDPHPSPSPTIPSPIPHPSPSPTIPSSIPHPSLSPTTIPSPMPHPCLRSDICPSTPRSFPEVSPIPSFDLGLDQPFLTCTCSHPPIVRPLALLHPSHIHPLALPSLHPYHIHPLAPPPSLHPPHFHVLGLTSVHPPHGHFLSCHLFHPSTWVLIQPLLTCTRNHPPTVRPLSLLRVSTHPMFRLSRLLGYLQSQQVDRNAYQRHLLVGQGGINMDTMLGLRHLTKDMQDLLLIIRDGNDSVDLDLYDVNDGNDQSCGNTENEEVILIGTTRENSAKVGLNEMVHVTSSALLDDGNESQKQCCENTESDELITWGAWKENNIKVGSEQTHPGMTTALINEKDGVRGFDIPVANDLDMVICLKSDEEESCLDSTKTQASSRSADVTSKQDYFVGELSDIEDEPTTGTIVTRSGQVCNLDLLEEIIEDAKNNKKTLFSAMERVINMMREVELQEKAAEEAKQEASRGGLNILVELEDLKQTLVHAKEANNMHAGEVYGEKSILATEVRELQSRVLSLADERDKSLAILNEMHQSLEARLSIAEEMRKAVEQERLDKEKSAQKALAEQNAIMEKVLQESKILKEEAEENSKLREFLIDRGHIVDMLQGEISVICQDVSLLKEKFDDRVPLSKSVSSSQTSCILAASGISAKSMVSGLVPEGTLASSGSSVKSMASDMVSEHSLASSGSSLKSEAPVLVTEQGKSSETPKRTSPTASVDSLSPRSRPEEERTKADHQALLDDGWDFFDKDAEFDI